MKNARLKTIVLIFICGYFVISCGEANKKTEHPAAVVPTGLNSVTTILPEATGYESFNRNCLSCHSARYVHMQPDLPEKTWTAIVTKMQKSFGAPVSDSSAKVIVEYLVAIKGKI